MSMSKKDFIALADAIRHHNRISSELTHQPDAFSDGQLYTLAMFCKQQNYAFKTDRWMSYIAGECGPNGGKK